MRPPIIDTHAHIFLPQFRDDFQFVMNRAADIGVTDIVMPCILPESLDQMNALPHLSRIKLHKTAGIHPCDVSSMHEGAAIRKWLEEQASSPEIVAIGETGLDYFWSTEYEALQKESLKIHLDAAKSLNKPVILHNRNATEDMLSIVASAQDGRLKGVWHCFTGTLEDGKRAIDIGLHLGIGGVVTYRNGLIDKYISEFPADRLVLETDSPYLSPVPNRGKRNEPENLIHIIKAMAQARSEAAFLVIEKTTLAAQKLFSLS